jgi:hypothetical protein
MSWSVDCDHAKVELFTQIVVLRGFEARAGEAVLVENGFACGRPILRVSKLTAIGKGQSGGCAVVEEEAAWGGRWRRRWSVGGEEPCLDGGD